MLRNSYAMKIAVTILAILAGSGQMHAQLSQTQATVQRAVFGKVC